MPQLVVISRGPLSGAAYTLRRGEQIVGRSTDADVVVSSPNLSRKHAYLSWDGESAHISDAGSLNGTSVNGELVRGRRRLRAGDVLRLGDVELRFEAPGAAATGPIPAASGPSFANQFEQDNYGDLYQAGGNMSFERHEHHEEPNAVTEIFQGRGFGRVLVAVGMLIALGGFAGWMYLIFAGGSSIDDPNGFKPFEAEVFGLPAAMVAFGTFALGGVIASIGYGMSKSARDREYRERQMLAGRLPPRY